MSLPLVRIYFHLPAGVGLPGPFGEVALGAIDLAASHLLCEVQVLHWAPAVGLVGAVAEGLVIFIVVESSLIEEWLLGLAVLVRVVFRGGAFGGWVACDVVEIVRQAVFFL